MSSVENSFGELGKVFSDIELDLYDFVEDVESFKRGGPLQRDGEPIRLSKGRWWFGHRFELGIYFFVYDWSPERVKDICKEIIGDDEDLYRRTIEGIEYILGYPLQSVLLDPAHALARELHNQETMWLGFLFEGQDWFGRVKNNFFSKPGSGYTSPLPRSPFTSLRFYKR